MRADAIISCDRLHRDQLIRTSPHSRGSLAVTRSAPKPQTSSFQSKFRDSHVWDSAFMHKRGICVSNGFDLLPFSCTWLWAFKF
eukprot:4752862-Pleurochrysis_carterae.AAC.3